MLFSMKLLHEYSSANWLSSLMFHHCFRKNQSKAVATVAVTSIISHWRSNHQPSCTLWTEKNAPECLLSCLLQNPTDSDKIWYMLSWLHLSYRVVNVFYCAWTMSALHYLVKLTIRVLQVNSSCRPNCESKKTPKYFAKRDQFWWNLD